MKAVQKFGSAILLVRNPFNALVSAWNYRKSRRVNFKTAHVGFMRPEYFGKRTFKEKHYVKGDLYCIVSMY